VYTDNGGGDPSVQTVPANSSSGSSNWATNPAGDHLQFGLDGASRRITIDAYSRARFNSLLRLTFCDFAGHAVVTP
jgi:hypothetical protein